MISRDLLIYYVGKAIPSLANLLIIVLGVRWLGEAGYGSFNLIYNAALVIASLSMGWLQQSSLRFVPGQELNELSLSKQYYGFGQWSALISFVLCSTFCFFYFQHKSTIALIAGVFAGLWSLLSVHLTLLQAQFSARSFALTESGYNLLILLSLATLIGLGLSASTSSFLLIFCIAVFITLCVSAMRGKWALQPMKVHSPILWQAIQFGFPLTIWLLVSNLFNVVDRYLISYYLDDTQTGMYASVYDLIYKLAALGCFPILLSKHPSIAAAWNNHAFEHAFNIIKQSLKLQALILVIMLLGGIFLGKWLILFFLNIEIPNYYILSIPLLISSVLWQMSLLIHKPLEMAHKSSTMIVFIVLSLALNCLLNILLIPQYGIVAAAYTTLASTLLYVALSMIYARKILKTIR